MIRGAGPRLLLDRTPRPRGVLACLWCLAPLEPSKTKPRVFCSDRCRKRVARVTVGRVSRATFIALQMQAAMEWKQGKAAEYASGISLGELEERIEDALVEGAVVDA